MERGLPAEPRPIGASNIWPVIDCRGGWSGLSETLVSLALAGTEIEPIIIGDAAAVGTCHVENVRELAGLVREERPWLLPLQPGDRLSSRAITAYAKAAAESPNVSLIYSDDDLISGQVRGTPHLKPDWNPELFEHHDYISGASIIRVSRQTLEDLPENGWAEVLTRTTVRAGNPVHIREVLHHRRSRPLPVIPGKPGRDDRSTEPSITAVIPTRNGHELLRTCIEGLQRAAYRNIETIIVDNGSDDPRTLDYLVELEEAGARVVRAPGPFNYSSLNNAAVRHASGELLCFLNNDVEMIDPDWLWILARHAVKTDIGAVGARLLYPDGTIQHAGVFTGIGGGAGHAHRFQGADDAGYFERARLPQRVSAVTAACMVVAREKFLAVGGFDEELFPVAFNDVDLCLKLNSRGWQSLYEPRSTLIHHESKSRGSDRSGAKRIRFASELAALKRVWNTDKFTDPYHHPHLSPFCEQFLISV